MNWHKRYAMEQKDFEKAWGGKPTSAEDLIGKHCDQCGIELADPVGLFCDRCGSSLGGQVL